MVDQDHGEHSFVRTASHVGDFTMFAVCSLSGIICMRIKVRRMNGTTIEQVFVEGYTHQKSAYHFCLPDKVENRQVHVLIN